jgi:hypothetical protein
MENYLASLKYYKLLNYKCYDKHRQWFNKVDKITRICQHFNAASLMIPI